MNESRKTYYVDVMYRTGETSRITLSEGTWVHWGGRCASREDNPFAQGKALFGLDSTNNPICIRTKDITTLQFGEWSGSPNPLNDEDVYGNPLN